MSDLMRIRHLLDLPLVSQSSGQTRRGRIAAAMLTKPLLLILEDPMAGLDKPSREEVSTLLGRLNEGGDIRIVLALRAKGEGTMPAWITDVCEVRDGQAWIGSREEWERRPRPQPTAHIENIDGDATETTKIMTEPLVKLNRVSVSYGEGTRPVLKDVSWEIKPGERWHLQGANGEYLLALLCRTSLSVESGKRSFAHTQAPGRRPCSP